MGNPLPGTGFLFLFIYPLRGLPGARPQAADPKKKTQSRPNQANQPKAAWNHPRLSGSILWTFLGSMASILSSLLLLGPFLPSLRLAFGKPLAGDGASHPQLLLITSFWFVPFRPRHWLSGAAAKKQDKHMPLQGERAPRPKKTSKEEDPKQTQSRPINPKQPGITQGFPALFSQLAFFKASFWETPCRGRGSLYISAGLDGAPVSFHFSSSGLARGQAPRRPPKKKTQSRPKADQSTQSSLESPKAFRLYSLNLPSLRLPSGKPLAGDGAPYILARGWMVHPFLFIFPLRGLPGARPQEDLQRRRPKADPKQTNQPKAAWNHPRLSGSILSTCLL